MELKKVKFYAISQLMIITIITVFFVAAILATSFYTDLVKKEYEDLKRRYESIQQEVHSVQRAIVRGKDSLDMWKKIGHKYKELNGLKIDEAYKLIKKLKERYKLMITNVKTNFMEPRVDKSFKHKHIKVVKGEVMMNITSYNDNSLFLFINDLKKEMPGFFQIESLDVKVINDPEKKLYSKIINKTAKGLVSAELRSNMV